MTKGAFRRSIVFWTILMVAVFCLAVVLLAGPVQAQSALLWLNPAAPTAGFGGTVDVDIQVDNITNVYGAEMGLSFDPTILQVVGGQLAAGSCPKPDFPVSNSADNTLGTIDYAASQLNPTLPCDGGVVATITFECIDEGISPVLFDSSIISDLDGNPIAHTIQDGTVECLGGITVIGTVALQAWADPSGVAVTLYGSGGGIVDGPVIVNSDGAFTLHATDMLDTYTVVAEYDRYLSVEKTGITGPAGDVVDLGLATLRAGDINGDGVINILDLTAVAGNFGKSSPQVWAP